MGLWITKRKDGKKTCWDIEITKGDSAYVTIQLTDMQEQGVEFRETDNVRCQVRSEQGTLLFEGQVEKLENGFVLWKITPEDTQNLGPGDYIWDMQAEFPDSNDVFTFIPLSSFTVLAQSTRGRLLTE